MSGLKIFLGLLGFALVAGGGWLVYHWYQNTQTFAYKLSVGLGNDAVARNVGLDLWGGIIIGLIGFVLLAVAGSKRG